MKTDELQRLSRKLYTNSVEGWSTETIIESGINQEEKSLLEEVPIKQGKLLLLGVGGGREAIFFARMGIEVTGVDFIPEMIKKTKENAIRYGVEIEGLVQDIYKLDVPACSYDFVWLSASMYSSIPNRKRRIKILKDIKKALKPEGYFFLTFWWDPSLKVSSKVYILRRLFGILTSGNLFYEKGDMLWLDREFIHVFFSKDILMAEFEEGGFDIISIHLPPKMMVGAGAILRKNK
ncbi:MAG: class I SAM-dependent methyltransferase [Candidatus Eremiobacterota bacterium]